ncbi:MAG: S16 family serine protease [Microbacteriaceae bacterium]
MNRNAHENLHFSSEPKRRNWIGWVLLALVPLIVLVISVQPAPYVISMPGPVYNTLGIVEINGVSSPMIAISDAETYPVDGQLNLLTVSQYGNPDRLPSWAQVLAAWFDSSQTITPLDVAYPPGITTEDIREQNHISMQNSQQEAIAAALKLLGYPVSGKYSVHSVLDSSHSFGLIEPGDVLLAINGSPITSVDDLRAFLATNGTSTAVTLTVVRDGTERDVHITPTLVDGRAALGVFLMAEYTFPIHVQIELKNVGGSSAGMMFALGIIDKLTPGSLTNGINIAGTGTITADGTVGPIGGEPQKVVAASRAGAKWFLMSGVDCPDLPAKTPEGMTIIPVDNLEQAYEAVQKIAAGAVPADFASCSAR